MNVALQILVAGGIMLAIAVIFGVILVICSNVFAVKRDERVEQVENLLAKSNCGGCGKAGCAQFAEALVKGEAKLSDCRATPAANKEKIAEILGGGEVGEDTVAVVHCNGGNACYDKYSYQGYGDCASCELIAGGVKACPVGCIGKKTCVNDCPFGAVSVGDGGYSVVDKENRKDSQKRESVYRVFQSRQGQGRHGAVQKRLYRVRDLRQKLSCRSNRDEGRLAGNRLCEMRGLPYLRGKVPAQVH